MSQRKPAHLTEDERRLVPPNLTARMYQADVVRDLLTTIDTLRGRVEELERSLANVAGYAKCQVVGAGIGTLIGEIDLPEAFRKDGATTPVSEMERKARAFDAIESELGPDRIQPTSRTLEIIRKRVADTRAEIEAARKAGA